MFNDCHQFGDYFAYLNGIYSIQDQSLDFHIYQMIGMFTINICRLLTLVYISNEVITDEMIEKISSRLKCEKSKSKMISMKHDV